ncbi:hypothetical protein B296_00025192 [Ensete ventricosum]|uniref:Uncharacterized protein n=1 Tax=Ensete ventricosum TaxID=4639 RepID=A0A426YSY0_ENSVE|nr:hypothetical protein B296_00025192 [Ensete ventricosum]
MGLVWIPMEKKSKSRPFSACYLTKRPIRKIFPTEMDQGTRKPQEKRKPAIALDKGTSPEGLLRKTTTTPEQEPEDPLQTKAEREGKPLL